MRPAKISGLVGKLAEEQKRPLDASVHLSTRKLGCGVSFEAGCSKFLGKVTTRICGRRNGVIGPPENCKTVEIDEVALCPACVRLREQRRDMATGKRTKQQILAEEEQRVRREEEKRRKAAAAAEMATRLAKKNEEKAEKTKPRPISLGGLLAGLDDRFRAKEEDAHALPIQAKTLGRNSGERLATSLENPGLHITSNTFGPGDLQRSKSLKRTSLVPSTTTQKELAFVAAVRQDQLRKVRILRNAQDADYVIESDLGTLELQSSRLRKFRHFLRAESKLVEVQKGYYLRDGMPF